MVLRRQLLTPRLILGALAVSLLGVAASCRAYTDAPPGPGDIAPLPSGPDALVLRVDRNGGRASALAFPALDSTVWRSSASLPPLSAVLGFDADDGYLTGVDTAGRAIRVDLRLGTVSVAGAQAVRNVTADGATVFAVDTNGTLSRYTPVGDSWRVRSVHGASDTAAGVLPLRDGSVLVATVSANARTDSRTIPLTVRRFRPPDSLPFDSLTVMFDVERDEPLPPLLAARVGERAFIAAGTQLHSFRTRDLVEDLVIDVGAPVHAMVPSPSGDRVYVASRDKRRVRVVDRFDARISDDIRLPIAPQALRMDPYGRVLLARGENEDVWVIDIGTRTLTGRVRSAWRADMPQVLPDGTIALAQDDDVVIVSSIDRGVVRTIPNATQEVWFAFRWNGFRPRASGIDQPVRFRELEARERAREQAREQARDSAPVPP